MKHSSSRGAGRKRTPAGFFGPGLVSAASNNDPTTVATLAVIGAATGYTLSWLVVIVLPMLALVQALAARVGAVCKTSLQGAIRRQYGVRWAIVTFFCVAAVNIFTLAADIKAGSEAVSLLAHVPSNLFIVPFTVLVGALLVSHSYSRIERYLSLLPLVFICYAASALLAHVDLGLLIRSVFVPQYSLAPLYTFAALALLGTTLTSYVYIWESIEVAERRPVETSIPIFEWDAVTGMLSVGVIFIFILVASAATLGKHHLPIETANDMAAALAPLAGPWAATFFGVGLLGSAVLAVPILASTTAYVAAHTFGWSGSLDHSFGSAKPFYGTLIASLAVAGVAAFAPVSPVAMLYWASIAGGFATPLTLAFLTMLAGTETVMGRYRMNRLVIAAAWAVTATVTAAGFASIFATVVHAA